MHHSIKEFWEIDHSKRTIDKDASNYSAEKEKLFQRHSRVLDLGGGRGADAVYFAKQGHTVVLADISDKALAMALERAKRDGIDIETRQVTLGTDLLPFEDNYFDVVYSRLALHYFDPNATKSIFKEIFRVLKHGGKGYLTLKSPLDSEEMAFLSKNAKQISNNVFEEEGMTKSRYSRDQLIEMITQVGILKYSINEINEDLINKIDTAKSGKKAFILNEVILTKE